MSADLESELLDHIANVEALVDLEKEIANLLPDQLWDRYCKLKDQIPSDASVLKEKLKKSQQSIVLGNKKFSTYKRSRTVVDSEGLVETARGLGHLDMLIELGVVKKVTVNPDQIQRLDPELAGIYQSFVSKTESTSVVWPKQL